MTRREDSSCSSTFLGKPSIVDSNTTFLPHLKLGNIGTSQDMTVEPNQKKLLEKANFLLTHDFAFILRRNGKWAYAMVAHRGPLGAQGEDVLLFVVDTDGSTKMLSKKHWATHIQMVNTNALSRAYEC